MTDNYDMNIDGHQPVKWTPKKQGPDDMAIMELTSTLFNKQESAMIN